MNNYSINEIPVKKNYTVFVNPFGGKGKAIKVWEEIKLSFFDKSNIEINLVKTEYYKHAYEYVLKMDFSNV
jgi:diacylglycerol kinase family enzyme